MENIMRVVTYIAALGLLAVAGCSQSGMGANDSGQVPFNNGTRQSLSQPTNCSPADSTCGTGIGNPSVQSPVQKRELNTTP
jgi:hypothetical protein